jgi:hypothetical protein
MFQDIMDELQFFPLLFNFDICGFDIYGTLVARINRIYRGLPVYALLQPTDYKVCWTYEACSVSKVP